MSATSVDALKSQLQSSRKALLFMQTEHAKTLHGLHDEIKALQKRCNELTFEIVVKEDEAYSNEAKTNIESLVEEATSSAQEKVLLIQQLEKKDKRIFELEHQFKTQEISYRNEIKSKNHKVAALAKELDLRANTIAYLTTQLHQAHSKIHLMKEKKPQQNISQEPIVPACEPTISPEQAAGGRSTRLTPTPPASGEGRRSSRRIHHRDKKSKSGEVRLVHNVSGSLLSEGGNIRPLSSSSESPRDSFSPRATSLTRAKVTAAFGNTTPSIPDPTPFLDRTSTKHSVAKVNKYQMQPSISTSRVYSRSSSRRSVLPPISKHATVDSFDSTSPKKCPGSEMVQVEDDESPSSMYVAPRRIKGTTATYDVPISNVCTTPEQHPAAVKRGVHKT